MKTAFNNLSSWYAKLRVEGLRYFHSPISSGLMRTACQSFFISRVGILTGAGLHFSAEIVLLAVRCKTRAKIFNRRLLRFSISCMVDLTATFLVSAQAVETLCLWTVSFVSLFYDFADLRTPKVHEWPATRYKRSMVAIHVQYCQWECCASIC